VRGTAGLDAAAGTPLDGLDLEVQADEGEDEGLEVLDEVVEDPEAVGVLAVLHVQQGPDLRRREADVLVAHHDLQLLAPHPVGLRPVLVVLPHDLGVRDDAAQLLQDGGQKFIFILFDLI